MVAWKVETLKPLTGYRLEVIFADGLHGIVDLSDVPHVGVFASWADPAYFERVTVNPETKTACWPNGEDVAPDAMYDEVKQRQSSAA